VVSPAVSHQRHALASRRLMLHEGGLTARAHPWPGEPEVAQLILFDAAAVPGPRHLAGWRRQLAELGFHTVRTGALAPRQATQAEAAGLRCIQELVLLEARPPLAEPASTLRTRRLRALQFGEAERIDRAAFGDPWWLDASMLAEVRSATPSFRARAVHVRQVAARAPEAPGPLAGFLISGRAGRNGYVQRLAVDPAAQRQGVAAALLADSLGWMRRWRAERVLVNTHVENQAALALYRSHGFVDLPERLRVFEGPTEPAPR